MKMKKFVPYIILVLVAVLPYINSLKNPLIWDDIELINDQNVKELKNITKFFTKSYWRDEFPSRKNTYRPLRAITFTVDYALWKKNPIGYHLTNTVLNTIAVVLTFLFAKTLSKSTIVGFITAIIFAVLPVHVEAVSWVKNRSEILSYIFSISSLIFFIKYSYPGIDFYIFSILFFILALMSKENAVILPFVVLVILLIRHYKYDRSLRAIAKQSILVLPYFLVLAVYTIFNYSNFKMEIGNTCSISIFSKDILIIPATIYEYLKILLWPFPLNPERDIDVPRLLSAPVGVSFIMIVLAVILLKSERFKSDNNFSYGFGLVFILIALVPVSNIINLEGRPIAEQRLYLPSFGFAYILALMFAPAVLQKKIIASAALITIISINGLMAFARNYDWRDMRNLLEKTVVASPFNARAKVNLALTYRYAGEYEKAIQILEALREIAPDYQNGLLALAKCYQDTGRYQEAIDIYEKVLKDSPKSYQALNALGSLYTKTGQFSYAIETYKKALKFSPDSAQLHYNLAVAYENAGDRESSLKEYELALKFTKNKSQYYTTVGMIYENQQETEKAIQMYKKALEIEPDYALAMYNLGMLMAKTGKYDEALQWFLKVEENLPGHTDNLNNIGIIYSIFGDSEKAVLYFNKAIKINPNDIKAYYNRAQVYIKTGNTELARNDLNKVLQLEPKNRDAKKLLNGL